VGEASSKGRTVDSKPGTRMDGYSLHEQKKLVLKEVKRGVESYKRKQNEGRTGSKGEG
jgi:hypothetical protein